MPVPLFDNTPDPSQYDHSIALIDRYETHINSRAASISRAATSIPTGAIKGHTGNIESAVSVSDWASEAKDAASLLFAGLSKRASDHSDQRKSLVNEINEKSLGLKK